MHALKARKGQSEKWLSIPVPINDYNHSMNGVDLGSQIQRGFSIHQPSETKWYRSIFYWIIDICQNNAFLIWKTTQKEQKRHVLHQRFIDWLIEEMLSYSLYTPAPGDPSQHSWHQEEKVGECAWGRKHRGACVQGDKKDANTRTVLTQVSGNARATTQARRVRTACSKCGVHLCIDRPCWRRYHASE